MATGRPRPLPPRAPNHVCAYDFVFDASANGQQLKCLTVVDEFTRESLVIDVAGSIRSTRMIEVLSRLVSIHGLEWFRSREEARVVIESRGAITTPRPHSSHALRIQAALRFHQPGSPFQVMNGPKLPRQVT